MAISQAKTERTEKALFQETHCCNYKNELKNSSALQFQLINSKITFMHINFLL